MVVFVLFIYRKELEELSHWLDWAWASYLADEKSIIDFLKVGHRFQYPLLLGIFLSQEVDFVSKQIEKEQIKKHVSKSSVTKPAYFIAVDNARKCVVLSIRGTYAATDVLTDLQPHSEAFEGG